MAMYPGPLPPTQIGPRPMPPAQIGGGTSYGMGGSATAPAAGMGGFGAPGAPGMLPGGARRRPRGQMPPQQLGPQGRLQSALMGLGGYQG